MFCLAIESSCDETSIAILEYNLESKPSFVKNFYKSINNIQIVSSIVSSQIDTHKLYGGVVPEVGARLHAEQIHQLYSTVLEQAILKLKINKSLFFKQLDQIFVTNEPGLMSALRVGIEFAKSLKFYIQTNYNSNVNLTFTNHLNGHVASCFYHPKNLKNYSDTDIFPHLQLIVSGGNTQLRLFQCWKEWQIIGQTIDDAAGECFDKCSRMLGIQYPGGATLSKIAGNLYSNPLSLPISMQNSHDLNLSFSGLKTAVRYKIQKSKVPKLVLDQKLTILEIDQLKSNENLDSNPKLNFVKQMCISTQFAIIEQIIKKIDKAITLHNPKSIGVSGGVSANKILIENISKLSSTQVLVFSPTSDLTGDNAIMIGLAGLLGH